MGTYGIYKAQVKTELGKGINFPIEEEKESIISGLTEQQIIIIHNCLTYSKMNVDSAILFYNSQCQFDEALEFCEVGERIEDVRQVIERMI